MERVLYFALLVLFCNGNCFSKSVDEVLTDGGPETDLIPAKPVSPFKGFDIGDPQNCPQVAVNIGEVLPGNGWDNLRNQAMGHVITYNYSKCKIFQDRSFLLPDNILRCTTEGEQC